MKKIISTTVCLLATLVMPTSCNWLDISPENGIPEEEVFGSYKNLKSYFSYIYGKQANFAYLGTFYEDTCGGRFSMETTCDNADAGRHTSAQKQFKKCNLSWKVVGDHNDADRDMSKKMFEFIRITNNTLEHLEGIYDCTEDEKNELYGMCYFTRAYCHFFLCRRWGGVPYIDRVLKSDDSWDLPRLSNWETYQKCAGDFYLAYQYLEKSGWMRRDALPGQTGYLSSSTQQYPSGMTALAMRARCLVYCASPLSNQKGTEDWIQAADACAEALAAADKWQFSLLPYEEYTKLFLNSGVTNESFWVYQKKYKNSSDAQSCGQLAFPQAYGGLSSGVCPTQNFVDRYETIWGDPLYTQQDRDYAESIGHYNPQDPYVNLDPRFELTIVHDGSTTPYVDGVINIYKNPTTGLWPTTRLSDSNVGFGMEWGTTDGEKLGWSNTGYYCRKFWDGQRGDKGASHYHTDELFRLSELYLLYAEAVNEAYGPMGTAGDCALTAVDAVNIIRRRVNMVDVQSRFTADKQAFRERIQNERCIELAFEGHHYYLDIRRWMIAPFTMTQTLYGMYITSTDNPQYPNGKIYERRPIPESRQGKVWKDCMYYFPFSQEQAQTMTNFINNDLWR